VNEKILLRALKTLKIFNKYEGEKKTKKKKNTSLKLILSGSQRQRRAATDSHFTRSAPFFPLLLLFFVSF